MVHKHHTEAASKGRISLTLHQCRSAIALLFHIPAFVFSMYGCTGTEMVRPAVPAGEDGEASLIIKTGTGIFSPAGGKTVDIFIFNDNALKRMDSYQRLEAGEDMTVAAASRKGDKIVVAIANPQQDEYEWSTVSSFETISGMYADLRREDPSSPMMTGVMRMEAADDGHFEMELQPILSEIYIRSIRCDFGGRPYVGSVLENGTVYLSNINSLAGIMEDETFVPTAPINTDGFPDEAIRSLENPGMVYAAFGCDIGSNAVYPDIRLYCYPSSGEEDSAGSPYTRLVIAGDIGGKRYYYPININRGEFGNIAGKPGIGRNCRYTLDITIRQTGSADPTVPVSPETVSIGAGIEPWNTVPEAEIKF